MAYRKNSYFNSFPKIDYNFGDTTINITDLSVRYKILNTIQESPEAFYTYFWKDSDKPHLIAQEYYGDADYGWLVLLSGELFHWLYDFPLSQDKFEEYLIEKYKKTGNELTQEIYHYERTDGTVIDKKTYESGIDLNSIDNQNPDNKEISVYDYEFKNNESKRYIKLISREYAHIIRDAINKLNTDIINLRETSTYIL